VKRYEANDLKGVGIVIRDEKKLVDKIIKGATRHP